MYTKARACIIYPLKAMRGMVIRSILGKSVKETNSMHKSTQSIHNMEDSQNSIAIISMT